MCFIECPVFEPEPGDRISIFIEYQGTWKKLFWFQISKDGSLYLNVRKKVTTCVRQSEQKATFENGKAETKFLYEDGKIVDYSTTNVNRVTYHASGKVHMGGEGIANVPIRGIKETLLLFIMLLEHPSLFEGFSTEKIKNKKGTRDVCLRYPVDEERPIIVYFYAAPLKDSHFIKIPCAHYQLNNEFIYTNLDQSVSSLALHVIMTHGAKGEWPKYSGLINAKFDE